MDMVANERTYIGSIRRLSPWMAKKLGKFCRKFGPVVRILHANERDVCYEPSLDTDEVVAMIGFSSVRGNVKAKSLLLLNIKDTFGTIHVTQDLWDLTDFDELGSHETERHANITVDGDCWQAAHPEDGFAFVNEGELTVGQQTVAAGTSFENRGTATIGVQNVQVGAHVENSGQLTIGPTA